MKPVKNQSPVPSVLMTAILVLFAAGSAWSVLQDPSEAKPEVSLDSAPLPSPVGLVSGLQAASLPSPVSAELSEKPVELQVEPATPEQIPEERAVQIPAVLPEKPTAAQLQKQTASAVTPNQPSTVSANPKPVEKPATPRPETPAPAPKPKVAPSVAPSAPAAPAATPNKQPRVEPQAGLAMPVPPPPLLPSAEPRKEEPKPITAVAPEREPRREVKAVSAPPLVKPQVKPQVIAANADRAWVKLNDQQTIIVPKGESVPGLGTFNGTVGGVAQFN